jgi:alkanesulfonate monooxygenase SsuD/methylene tetrahydromethanopterin reductase-like flavin-dependent oxidoreductase (luciferase family)
LTEIKFGCQLPQETDDFEKLVGIAERCEDIGYDSVWAYDHLAPYWTQRGQSFECWTVLAAIAQRTTRIKLGSLVTNVNLRKPALLAKITSTFDNISKGRLILGLGTGDRMSRSELVSYGYPLSSINERVERLRETILILKSMWTEDQTSFESRHNRLSNAFSYPKPIQTPHPPIWIGGKHTRILDIVAEMADGWNYWGLDREMLARRTKYLSKKCAKVGRQPDEIVKSWAGTLSRALRRGGSRTELEQSIREQLMSQTDHETRYFIGSFGSSADTLAYETFAEAVKSLE